MTPRTFTRLAILAALIGAPLTCTDWHPIGYLLCAPIAAIVYLTAKEAAHAH